MDSISANGFIKCALNLKTQTYQLFACDPLHSVVPSLTGKRYW